MSARFEKVLGFPKSRHGVKQNTDSGSQLIFAQILAEPKTNVLLPDRLFLLLLDESLKDLQLHTFTDHEL